MTEVRDTLRHSLKRTSETKGHSQLYGSSAADLTSLNERAAGGVGTSNRRHYGALSTSQQAFGSLDICGPACGFECSSRMLLSKRSISLVWQTYPSGRGGCDSQSGLSGGQSRRI